MKDNSAAVGRTVVGIVLCHPSHLGEARDLVRSAGTEGQGHTLALLVGMKTALVLEGAVGLTL